MPIDFLDHLSPTPAAYQAAARRLLAEPPAGLQPLRVAIAASFTADPLGKYLAVEGARRGFAIEPSFTPYSQFELQCLDPASALFAGRPDVAVLATRLEELVPALWQNYGALDEPARRQIALEACERVARMAAALRQHGTAQVLVFNFTEPVRASGEPGRGRAHLVEIANSRLEQIAHEHSGVVIFDFARFALEIGLRQMFDARLDAVSRMPFGVAAQIALAGRLARSIRALRVPPLKCLVLDLDDTLWGGILGEVGPGGIALGNDYPGRAFADFQRAVRDLRHRGILLAIASKNNPPDVCEVFERHPDMVLRWHDFAAAQIHWEDKAASLAAIAAELRIGIDSLAFYDDSPVEREWIRSRLPEVAVIEVPEDPLQRIAALDEFEGFDQVFVSEEDRRRGTLYQHDRERERVRAQSASLDEFLAQLQIRATVGLVNAETLPRVAQLIHKTNQFNLTGRRHSEGELRRQLDEGAIACWLRASDRFGDYGVVGAAVAVPERPHAWRIDNFLLSCRILGRQVETALLAALARRVAESGGDELIGEYLPTPKNAPACDFYPRHGFAPEGGRWVWRFSRGCILAPDHIALEEAR